MTVYLSSQTIRVFINRPAQEVYEYAYNMENFPQWVSFCQSIQKTDEGDAWMMETPYCISEVRVAQKNSFGVLDHRSIPAPGVEICDAMRVIPNGDGCEVFLTGFQMPRMSHEKFSQVITTGQQDLNNLKTVLEGGN
ncbi:Polyketide cyclase / dehydrase and lipid transport [Bacillus sp. OV194]|nr:Polyketide cyclase / dehydrase and lipid transport [Bacillus sp. OV194]